MYYQQTSYGLNDCGIWGDLKKGSNLAKYSEHSGSKKGRGCYSTEFKDRT
eukprot:UN07695